MVHYVSSRPLLGLNPLVGIATPDLVSAWRDVADTWEASASDPRLTGFISSPGRNQRLVVVDAGRRRVAKTNVLPDGRAALEAEVVKVATIARAVPSALEYSTSVTSAGRLLLLSSQVLGRIPRWDNERDRRLARDVLRLPGNVSLAELDLCGSCLLGGSRSAPKLRSAVWHGDFVPWNVRIGEDYRPHIFDWEFASVAKPWPALFNELEWILRGAVASSVSPTRRKVRTLVEASAHEHGMDQYDLGVIIQMYLCLSWRNKARASRAHNDDLMHALFRGLPVSPACGSWRQWRGWL